MVQLFIPAFITVRWIDVLDILLVAMLIYQLYYLVKGTVAINIFVGIMLIYTLWIVVRAANMQLFGSILGKFIDVGFIALLIVFQPELRRFLLFLGTSDIFTCFHNGVNVECLCWTNIPFKIKKSFSNFSFCENIRCS